jgi:hypothetical protein
MQCGASVVVSVWVFFFFFLERESTHWIGSRSFVDSTTHQVVLLPKQQTQAIFFFYRVGLRPAFLLPRRRAHVRTPAAAAVAVQYFFFYPRASGRSGSSVPPPRCGQPCSCSTTTNPPLRPSPPSLSLCVPGAVEPIFQSHPNTLKHSRGTDTYPKKNILSECFPLTKVYSTFFYPRVWAIWILCTAFALWCTAFALWSTLQYHQSTTSIW